jgi:hypothetical protein
MGFRPGRRAEDALIFFAQKIKQAKRNGNILVAVKLDAYKAYDKVWTKGLIYKLFHRTGIFGPLLRLLASYMTDRKATVAIGKVMSLLHAILAGVPQGGRPSPQLFNIDFDDLDAVMTGAVGGLAGGTMFADDIILWIEIPGPAHGGQWRWRACDLIRRFQEEVLDEAIRIAAMAGRSFSTDPDKLQCTAFVPTGFQSARALDALPCLFVGTTPMVIRTGSITVLGVEFDSDLKFDAHIDTLVKRAEKRTDVLRQLSSRSWSTGRHTLLTIWRTWIRSLLTYASTVWAAADHLLLKRLDKIQRRALSCCLPYRRGQRRPSPSSSSSRRHCSKSQNYPFPS